MEEGIKGKKGNLIRILFTRFPTSSINQGTYYSVSHIDEIQG
ncbi:hypothetical protein MC7420_8289 [Coleofasciculus chthonoplastes PCC 7420]|uniref:Uncharacterized protein n=1 Tax=Coleofasciculus chthonoplastes PCC 7420 TaxID=118168 RepID=B4W0R1_9CYAN|nr:hypothetical protein MC7420_8289 [Coleofasciculus chthonoplastes PCC 7420]